MRIFILSFFLMMASFTANAQLQCRQIFSELPASTNKLTNFQETLALLYFLTGEKLVGPLAEQAQVLESYRRLDTPLLNKLNLEKYVSADGATSLHWKYVDLSNPVSASKALVRMSRLLAIQQIKEIRTQKNFLTRGRDYKSDTLKRIEHEVYLKALLQAEEYFQVSSQLSLFLPRTWLKVHNVQLEQRFVDILNQQGLEAFHKAIENRYGFNVSAHILQKTTTRLFQVASSISIAIFVYYFQQGDDYFDKVLKLESGLSGEDHNLFSDIVQKSGLKTPQNILNWLEKQNFEDSDMKDFVQELQIELQSSK